MDAGQTAATYLPERSNSRAALTCACARTCVCVVMTELLLTPYTIYTTILISETVSEMCVQKPMHYS